MSETPLVNRVANSGLITLNLEDYFPVVQRAKFDLKDHLYMGLMLKEADFRQSLAEYDWSQYQDQVLLVYCSTDAIIPMWAYMLVVTHAQPFVADLFQGTEEEYLKAHYHRVLRSLDVSQYAGQRMVIKGCGDHPVPAEAYLELTRLLRPVAQSILYGEPCSTVPIYKKPKGSNA